MRSWRVISAWPSELSCLLWYALSLSLFLSHSLFLSFFVSLCFLFYFNRRRRPAGKYKEEWDEKKRRRGRDSGPRGPFFFSFSPAKQQVLFGNEWRTSREKKREIGSKEKEVKMTATKKKAIQNPLSWNLKIFQLYIFMSLYSTKKET